MTFTDLELGASGCLVSIPGSENYPTEEALLEQGWQRLADQHSLPPESVPECGPGLDYIISTLPMAEAIEKIFTGSGECAATSWTFVGITMPGWVLVWMLVFGAASICSLWADQRTS